MGEVKEKILRLLKTDARRIAAGKENSRGYISGQGISELLGISRAAVWKHIRDLRSSGFSIEASPSKGYRLLCKNEPFNSAAIGAGLATEFIGRPLYFYEELDSTNSRAVELARAGAPEGAAVVADTQTKGRGRLNRIWVSPPGVNLYTSVILRPSIPPARGPELTLMAAVALAETVKGFLSGLSPVVKWPNDILLNSKKVAGILTEMHSEPDRIDFIVLGIGVNINMDVSILPDGLRTIATSLKEKSGGTIPRPAFTQALYSYLEKWYKLYFSRGFGAVREAWRGFFTSEGKPVRVRTMDRVIEGICMGLAEDGALLVKTPSGALERVVSGDMVGGPGLQDN